MKLIIFLFFLVVSTYNANASIRVTGKVTDKNGNSVEKCDVYFNAKAWIDENSIHVKCDSYGNYSAELEPGRYNSIYICDEELYGKTRLEFWGWNLDFDKSQTLNAQFDKLEVYSLATWASNGGSNSIFASFRPMSLTKAKQAQYKSVILNSESILVFDISPEIDSSSIIGFIDEQPLTLLGYSWAYEKVQNCGKLPENIDAPNGCHMPMIVAQFEKPKLIAGKHLLKINLLDSKNGDFGQGVTNFYSNSKGLGF